MSATQYPISIRVPLSGQAFFDKDRAKFFVAGKLILAVVQFKELGSFKRPGCSNSPAVMQKRTPILRAASESLPLPSIPLS
jgi:hypothetical protein